MCTVVDNEKVDCGSCGCGESSNVNNHSGDGLWCSDCGNYRV